MTTTTHSLTLDPRRPGARFSGSCSCGALIDNCSTAGMVHGWHGIHVDEVVAIQPAFIPASSLRPGDEIPDVDHDGRPAVAVVQEVETTGRSTRLRVETRNGTIRLTVPASRTYEVER